MEQSSSLKCVLCLILCFEIIVRNANSSEGDRLPYFRNCLMKCFDRTAAADYDDDIINKNADDCNYKCIWQTVKFRLQRNLHIPQFYGRWPLIRIIGLEEPASVLFSILNGFVHCCYYRKLYANILDKKSNIYFWNSTLFFLVSLHTWFWSMVFHARNTYFTELMDYSCAFSVLLVSNFLMIYRIFNRRLHGPLLKILVSIQISTFVHYVLAMSRKIDYGFNMKLNVLLGAVTSIGWLLWAFFRPTAITRFLVWFICLTSFALIFELIEFVPIFWIFDAHSCWHLCTAITTPLFYRFVG